MNKKVFLIITKINSEYADCSQYLNAANAGSSSEDEWCRFIAKSQEMCGMVNDLEDGEGGEKIGEFILFPPKDDFLVCLVRGCQKHWKSEGDFDEVKGEKIIKRLREEIDKQFPEFKNPGVGIIFHAALRDEIKRIVRNVYDSSRNYFCSRISSGGDWSTIYTESYKKIIKDNRLSLKEIKELWKYYIKEKFQTVSLHELTTQALIIEGIYDSQDSGESADGRQKYEVEFGNKKFADFVRELRTRDDLNQFFEEYEGDGLEKIKKKFEELEPEDVLYMSLDKDHFSLEPIKKFLDWHKEFKNLVNEELI